MERRDILVLGAAATLGSLAARARSQPAPDAAGGAPITMFLAGDVMTGRGIDQVLPHPSDPRLYERVVRDARDYVALAERTNGAIDRPVDFAYVWGDALAELARVDPDVRIVNLETAVTTSPDWWRGKGINYRMHPDNVPCLTAAGIDCCALANNHVLDWGHAGLAETLDALAGAGIAPAGAGRNLGRAQAPAVLDVAGKGRVVVLAFGVLTSGIPRDWTAGDDRGGVDLLPDLSPATVDGIAARVQAVKRAGDVVVASVHWGGNWGYDVGVRERAFAHALLERAGVDVVHGHSSHHPKGIEVHAGKLVLYGCGDWLNDYEGIGGHERFRGELGLMYFATVDPATGALAGLRLVPTRVHRFRIRRAGDEDAAWLFDVLRRESRRLGTDLAREADGAFALRRP